MSEKKKRRKSLHEYLTERAQAEGITVSECLSKIMKELAAKPKTYHKQDCYLCAGERFFDLGNGTHYGCPLCGMSGSILVKDGESPPVPGGLVRRILEELGG